MKEKLFVLVFSLALGADLFFIAQTLPYRFFSKPLIMLALIGLYLSKNRASSPGSTWFLAALVFAFLGDVFLLFEGASFFIMGLVSFLVMQLIYAYLFSKERKASVGFIIGTILLLLVYAIGFNSYTWSKVGDLKIAVAVYSVAIAIMVFFGIIRDRCIPGYGYIVLGVLLFLISDSALALGKFAGGFPHVGITVMATYGLAQYFIVNGYLRQQVNA